MNIGFIGCGHMGAPMVGNLLAAGMQVQVYDIDPRAIASVVAQGALPASSVKNIAQQADVIFTMLQTGEQVSNTCLGADGIFANAKPGVLYIDSSSIDVATSRNLHNIAEQHFIAMLDAPVSGGVYGAQHATLTFMVGGDAEIFERAKPLLATLGRNIIHVGRAGNGEVAKICNNMLLGISMIASAEAFTLGQQLGVDPKTLFDIVSKSSGQCWALNCYAPIPGLESQALSAREFTPGFTGKMMLKDLRLSQLAASATATYTPLGHHAMELYQQLVDDGYGDKDFSVVIKMLEASQG